MKCLILFYCLVIVASVSARGARRQDDGDENETTTVENDVDEDWDSGHPTFHRLRQRSKRAAASKKRTVMKRQDDGDDDDTTILPHIPDDLPEDYVITDEFVNVGEEDEENEEPTEGFDEVEAEGFEDYASFRYSPPRSKNMRNRVNRKRNGSH